MASLQHSRATNNLMRRRNVMNFCNTKRLRNSPWLQCAFVIICLLYCTPFVRIADHMEIPLRNVRCRAELAFYSITLLKDAKLRVAGSFNSVATVWGTMYPYPAGRSNQGTRDNGVCAITQRSLPEPRTAPNMPTCQSRFTFDDSEESFAIQGAQRQPGKDHRALNRKIVPK